MSICDSSLNNFDSIFSLSEYACTKEKAGCLNSKVESCSCSLIKKGDGPYRRIKELWKRCTLWYYCDFCHCRCRQSHFFTAPEVYIIAGVILAVYYYCCFIHFSICRRVHFRRQREAKRLAARRLNRPCVLNRYFPFSIFGT